MRILRRVALKALLALDVPRRLQRLLDMNQALPEFANTPRDLKIGRPFKIANSRSIYMGNNVRLGSGCALLPITRYPPRSWLGDHADENDQQIFNPMLRIGNGVVSSGLLQIFVQERVDIEDNVMFASNVFINDAAHGYVSANSPYKDQPLFRIAPVRIGQGCWIGQNVVILPGVKIGELSIVGANSVVTHDVPARCIVAGAPARVIRRWDPRADAWATEHTRGDGGADLY